MKQLYPTDSVKYLGIVIGKNLNWHHQISKVAAKLNRAHAMLSKIRHFVNFNILKSIYHDILESHLFLILFLKMLTRLKDFWSYKGNPYELCIFWKEMHINLISLKT